MVGANSTTLAIGESGDEGVLLPVHGEKVPAGG